MSTIAYRSDIDGLRAVAVLAIIIYHTNSQWLPGGVASLGIFFVISGYLITSIIHKEIAGQAFTFTRFYTRRIKRILPLFYAVIAITVFAGFWLLSPKEFQELGKSMRYATFFLANLYFAQEQDYFAPDAEETPLLHLWTLSVEEQYYLIWPILLLVLVRRLPRLVLPACLLLGAGSFTLATVWALDPAMASHSYYSLPTRFGEFLIGSLLALYRPAAVSQRQANVASMAGALLVAGALVLVNDSVTYPGFHALWSCCGTALLIYGGSTGSQPWPNRLLALRPVVFLGLISYSLYLWHWPILAYARYYTATSVLGLPWVVACLGLTLGLSYLSWRFIEQPARLQKLNFGQAARRYFLFPALVILVAAAYIKKSDGYLWLDDDRKIHDITVGKVGCVNRLDSSCIIGAEGGDSRAVIYGDSHAVHFSVMFDLLGRHQGWNADFLAAYGCPFLPDNYDRLINKDDCRRMYAHLKDNLGRYDTIVMAFRWHFYMANGDEAQTQKSIRFRQQLEQVVDEYVADGKRVILVAQIPEFSHDRLRTYRNAKGLFRDLQQPPVIIEYTDYQWSNDVIRTLAEKRDRVDYLDFGPVILGWGNAIVNGLPLYEDNNHLNHLGQEHLYTEVVDRDAYHWLPDRLIQRSEASTSPLR